MIGADTVLLRFPHRRLGTATVAIGLALLLAGFALGQRPYLNMPPRLPRRPGEWLTVPAFPKLRFRVPTLLTHAPGMDRLYVLERDGRVLSFPNDPDAGEATVVLDLREQCQGGGDCGLLGLAFHPDFGKANSPNRGYFYVFYNWCDSPVHLPDIPPPDKKTRDRLSRFTLPDGSLVADRRSELVLIDQDDEHVWHTGGGMFFHPDDRFLYLAVGDEGGIGGQFGNCQRIDRDLFSGVLRIDVDCDPSRSHPPKRQPETGRTAHCFIPNDNPFVGVPNALEEFWCIGLRSPHRMTLDPITGRIWLGDVGQDGREEIDLVVKGGNYQWNYREGNLDRPGFAARPERPLGVEVPPVHEYPHENGNGCVIGGHVYRGREHQADLEGKYIFGDHVSGRLWTLALQKDAPPRVEELGTLPHHTNKLTSFGVDRHGELYLCEANGIMKLARAGSPAAPLTDQGEVPRRLSQTGAFRDTHTLTPADGLLPYTVNCPLWSDGAVKSRWAAIPSKIASGRPGEWLFPTGTVFVKHFELPADDDPSVRRRLETRLLVRDPDGSVYGVTYRWNDEQTDAELLDDTLTEDVTGRGRANDHAQRWTYPSRKDCLTCHNGNAGFVLGVNIRQLNRDERNPSTGAVENQLLTWSRRGVFREALPDLTTLPRLAAIDDRTASLDHRVRSYLDANCGYCHIPHGVRAYFDARLEVPFKHQRLLNGPVYWTNGPPGTRVVVPGSEELSLLYRRMTSCDPLVRMPPLGRTVCDRMAAEAVREWLHELPPKPAAPEWKPTTSRLKVWVRRAAAGAGVLLLTGGFGWWLRRRPRRVSSK